MAGAGAGRGPAARAAGGHRHRPDVRAALHLPSHRPCAALALPGSVGRRLPRSLGPRALGQARQRSSPPVARGAGDRARRRGGAQHAGAAPGVLAVLRARHVAQVSRRRQRLRRRRAGAVRLQRVAAATSPLVLTHAGNLYGARNPLPLLEGLAACLRDGRLPARGIRLDLVGKVAASFDVDAAIARLGLSGVVIRTPPVAHRRRRSSSCPRRTCWSSSSRTRRCRFRQSSTSTSACADQSSLWPTKAPSRAVVRDGDFGVVVAADGRRWHRRGADRSCIGVARRSCPRMHRAIVRRREFDARDSSRGLMSEIARRSRARRRLPALCRRVPLRRERSSNAHSLHGPVLQLARRSGRIARVRVRRALGRPGPPGHAARGQSESQDAQHDHDADGRARRRHGGPSPDLQPHSRQLRATHRELPLVRGRRADQGAHDPRRRRRLCLVDAAHHRGGRLARRVRQARAVRLRGARSLAGIGGRRRRADPRDAGAS